MRIQNQYYDKHILITLSIIILGFLFFILVCGCADSGPGTFVRSGDQILAVLGDTSKGLEAYLQGINIYPTGDWNYMRAASIAYLKGDSYLLGKPFLPSWIRPDDSLSMNIQLIQYAAILGNRFARDQLRDVKISWDDPKRYCDLAEACMDVTISLRQLDYGAAEDFASQAIELDSLNTRAWNDYGNALYYLKKYDKALGAYYTVVRLNPTAGYALCNIASTFEQKGDISSATKYYKEAAKLGNQKAQEWLEAKGYSTEKE